MRPGPRIAVTVLATLLAVVVALAVVVSTGVYDISATKPHSGVTERLLDAVQRRSIGVRADEPAHGLPTDSAALRSGFHHFDEMCVTCHGAPGVGRSEIGRGITPRPPDLVEAGPTWSDGELIRITSEGIRLAGMPAFGPTHTEEEIREIVAVVRMLPRMDSADYASWRAAVGSGGAGHMHGGVDPDGADDAGADHTHADGGDDHTH